MTNMLCDTDVVTMTNMPYDTDVVAMTNMLYDTDEVTITNMLYDTDVVAVGAFAACTAPEDVVASRQRIAPTITSMPHDN